MIIDELFEGPQLCPECGGISFSDLILAEKKDACYYKVKASAKVWPSAYASGRLVQCRKKGAANYGKSKTESVAEQQELDEKWSQKYKKSINCANPRGFSQKAHCAGRKKNEDVAEAGPLRRDPLDYPPLEGPGGSGTGGYTGGPSPFRGIFGRSKEAPVTEPKWSTTKIPGVDVHTGPPPTSKSASTNVKIDPAADVPAYIRKGLPDPVTTPVNKPKISMRPGETMDQAIQRTQTEKEFGRFLQGQSGQKFGAGAGRGGQGGPTAAQSTADQVPTVKLPSGQTIPDPNALSPSGKYSTQSPSEFEKTMQKWDQQNNPVPSKGQRPWGSDIEDQPGWAQSQRPKTKPSMMSKFLGGGLDEASPKKREQPEVDYDDEYDAMVARVKKLAGLGPMKTVYDPKKRQYRNMPTAVQPPKK